MPSPTRSPTKTPTRTPQRSPKPDTTKRYEPLPDHCPSQWTRTVRKIREV